MEIENRDDIDSIEDDNEDKNNPKKDYYEKIMDILNDDDLFDN